MHLLVVGDDDAFERYIQVPRQCGTISVSCGRRDDHIDIGQRQPGVTQALTGRLRCGSGQPLVEIR